VSPARGETGIEHTTPPALDQKAKPPVFQKAELKARMTAQGARPALQQTSPTRAAFQGTHPSPPAEPRTARPIGDRADGTEHFGETAEALRNNLTMRFANEQVSDHHCVANYQKASVFSPNDTTVSN